MRLWPVVVLMLTLPWEASAARVAGVDLAERTTVAACHLVLNGAGLRKKLFFKVYVLGLYVTERRQSPVDLLELPGPKRISITLLRTLPARRLVDALENGVRRNSSPDEFGKVKSRLDELAARMLPILEGEKGDVVSFDWLPEAGTLVVVNGVAKGGAVPGADVYGALLKVWLGEHPESGALKKSLLGLTE
jgi:hypothetical protein